MYETEISRGEGRMRVSLSAQRLGAELLVSIYNENAHIGAVAVAEYDHIEKRTSTSVITRLGHKDDAIAQRAAYVISKYTKKPCCVVAGIHLDDISPEEIQKCLENAESLVKDLLERLPKG